MKVSPASTSVVLKVPITVPTALFSAMLLLDKLISVGASLAGDKLMDTVAVFEERTPSEAVTVKVLAPFAFAAGT